ncbi:MAG: Mrp/NBP35 family ATP-binding protein [Bacteriovoracales bacterium]|nr:Mrp/NBP35 family ATP-binding protein [Bacteriovoracales bacterium]
MAGQSTIKNEVLDLLEHILNPQTGRGLFAEKRVIDVKADNNSCHISVNTSKLADKSTAKIKEDMTQALSRLYHSKDIHLSFAETAPPKEGQTPSSLKVGHEQIPKKKKTIQSAKKIIAIASGKGGVGKSAFTANLALALKRQGFSIGVIDADIYGPSLPMIFGQRKSRPISSQNKKIVPIEAFGISFMSFGFFIEEDDPVIWRGPMLGGVIQQFLFDVEWPKLDFLLIDLPPGTGDIQLSLSQLIDLTGAIIISTPQDVALLDAKKGLKMFQKINIPILGMVQNMSYFIGDDEKKYYIFGKNGVKSESEKLDIPFLGEIPMEIPLRESSDRGIPYMAQEEYRDKPAWQAFSSIADKLGRSAFPKEDKGFFQRLLKR